MTAGNGCKRVVICAATEEELSLYAPPEQRTPTDAIQYVVTGEGGVNVIKALDPFPRDATMIINVGYAGSNTLPIGSLHLVGKVQQYHEIAKIDEPVFDLGGLVPCYTASDFVTQTTITEPCLFDMELAYIAAMGFKHITSFKKVSDNLNYDEFKNFWRE